MYVSGRFFLFFFYFCLIIFLLKSMEELLKAGWTRVRADIDVGRLCSFLNEQNIRPTAFDPQHVTVLQSNNGMSNPTFYVKQQQDDFNDEQGCDHFPALVIRKKPAGKLLPGAHQIEREYRAMKHLAGTPVPVPNVHALCEDSSVLGQPFYVMDFVAGTVPSDPGLPDLSKTQRAGVFAHAVQILADLHNLDFVKLGLGKHGRVGNYAQRQLRTWTRQYDLGDQQLVAYVEQCEKQRAAAASQLTRIGAKERGGAGVGVSTQSSSDSKDRLVERVLAAGGKMRQLIAQLQQLAEQRISEQSTVSDRRQAGAGNSRQCCDETTLVHGDFRMGNFILDNNGGRIRAVLDWEISTLGHPLLDLAYLVSPYYSTGEGGFVRDPRTGKGGLPDGVPQLSTYMQMYCEARGIPRIPESEWNFWVALNCFRTAAIVHGVFARFVAGNAGSTNASYGGSAFIVEVEKGLRMLNGDRPQKTSTVSAKL